MSSLPLFSPSLRLPPGLPSPDLGAAWTFQAVCCQHLSKMLQLPCYIPVALLFIYVFSILDWVWLYCKMFFSPSLYSLYPVSLFFLSFTWPTLSRRVPPCKPGPAQGFFLLKGTFSLATVLTWRFWLWVSASVKHPETILL